MTAERVDLAVIGAGPGGMGAARSFSEQAPDARILILDGGRKTRKRHCPVLFREKDCKGCGGVCQVIEGIGGACSSVSCGMLSEYPAGSGQLDYWSMQLLMALERKTMDWVEQVNGGPLLRVEPNVEPALVQRAEQKDMRLKTYPSSEVDGAQFEELMNALFDDILRNDNVEARFAQRVVDITRVNGKLCVVTSTGSVIEADNVIFATGRAGDSRTTEMLNKLGAVVKGASGYIGLRFEHLAHERLIQMRHEVLDPKFMRDGMRMFCFCPQGKVVGMRVPDSMAAMLTEGNSSTIDTLEGCVWPNAPFGNFSVQQGVQFASAEDLADWEKAFVQKHLAAANGEIIGQSFRSLRDNERPEGNPNDFAGSSIPTRWRVASIRDVLPGDIVDAGIQFILDFDEIIGGGLVNDNAPNTVYAPEIHIWPKFAVDASMQTTVDGLYVVGDMSGVARGILQAMNMGRVAGISAAGGDVHQIIGALQA